MSNGAQPRANLTSVPITGGVPGGTGTVSTIDALMAQLTAGQNVSITNANVNLRALPAGSAPVVLNSQTYKACPASATTTMGATGATGDYLDGVLIVPSIAAPGAVQIQDGAGTAMTVFAGGGTVALPTLAPFYVPIGAVSAAGAWKVITLAGCTAIGIGNFT